MAITRVGIVGSGIMGTGIAEVAAASGHDVVLRSRSDDGAQDMRSRLEKSLNRQVERERKTEVERDDILGRVQVTTKLSELADSDLVIESVIEDRAVKQALFCELDSLCADAAVIATNTSTLAVVELAIATKRPERVCGIHFFNPAPVMALVELVRPITASDDTMDIARRFATGCGKETVEVKDEAGFVVNALLFPYLNNAIRLLEGGVATKEGIDAAMVGGCGFPMGPFAVLDLVGLDTSLAILDSLYEERHEPNYSAVPLLRRMVAARQLGRKSGRGFYDYRT
jgi:3-hydroxybutyryl-CoA dehydrogenase